MSEHTIMYSGKIPRRILVIKPSSLGDIVHALPFLYELKESFPSSEIHWVVARGFEGILEHHPMITRLWIINKNEWKKTDRIGSTITEFTELYRNFRNTAFDLTIDLQGLLRSGILCLAAGSPVRVGFREAREGSTIFYTHCVEGGTDIHAVDRYLKISAALGCTPGTVRFPLPLVKESSFVSEIKARAGTYAVIAAGARWRTKKWHPERFAFVARELPVNSILIGGKADIPDAETIASGSGGKALSAAGQTVVRDLIPLLRSARVLITNDSGPMHIAAALGIPIVSVFGPTNPVRTGPYGYSEGIIRSTLPCAPCYRKKCRKLSCMEEITAVRVLDQALPYCKEVS